jgi:hypothetical protein
VATRSTVADTSSTAGGDSGSTDCVEQAIDVELT